MRGGGLIALWAWMEVMEGEGANRAIKENNETR